ncbi:MAG: type I DNA topoisomerase [Rhodospirillales bacterium]|nr:type I DNA topoisomerase [Rhodospirillales bacterium]
MNAVVVVESPAKAKTINKYLGKDYQVLASYGHVRDLPAKDGSVRPDEEFAMSWTVDARAEKRLKEIAQAVKGAERLYLATDPDREGEAISWHIAEELKRRRALAGVEVKRVVFNEVTKRAVIEAFQHPRELNGELIDAYLARRALDYLVGFTLSPVLWRKLPGSKSAGRVQSVALRLICEREAEIEVFRPQEYWTVEVALRNAADATFTARLTHLDGRKLEKFDLSDEASASAATRRLEQAAGFQVESVERKETRRNPFPPFTTSTLQQEASRKLGFGATRTMRLAQQLYEGVDLGGETVGLITYMRTDGVQISQEALSSVREVIFERFGDAYLPSGPRLYKTKAKNAQEAHEAIRPTNLRCAPGDLKRHLAPDAQRLYELIWKRTVASQMESARLEQVAVDIAVDRDAARLRANGSVVLFDGFLTLYQESRDEPQEGEGKEPRLPKLTEGEGLAREGVTPEQHFTQPPPRFTEASLVKRLEELGIGRPSTYASILQVLQDRDYVRLEKRRFLPQDRGRLVTAFLTSFFQRYVEYGFTADMEQKLDEISGGRIAWRDVLHQFWEAFHKAVDETKGLRIAAVIDALDEDLGPHFFPTDPEKPEVDLRTCPSCKTGRLGLRLAKNGGFIGCSNYPDCRYTRPLAVPGNGEDAVLGEGNGPKLLGQDPASGLAVSLRKGPYGFYAQLGEAEDGEKPKRVSVPRDMSLDQVTLDRALALLALPREVGRHPESGEPISAGIGRYGPYIRHGGTYCSLKGDDDVLAIGLNRAVALLAEAPARGRAPAGKPLGDHPEDGKPVTLHSGRYGPYVKHGRVFASLPKGTESESATLDMAVELLAAKAAKSKTKKPAKKKKASGKRKSTSKKQASPTAKA